MTKKTPKPKPSRFLWDAGDMVVIKKTLPKKKG